MKNIFSPVLAFFYEFFALLKGLFIFVCGLCSKRKISNVKNSIKNELLNISNKTKNFYITNLRLALYHFHKENMNDAKFRLNLLNIFHKNKHLVQYNLARIYLIEGNKSQAKKHFLKALNLTSWQMKRAKFFLKYIENNKVDNMPPQIAQEKFNFVAHYYVEHFLVNKNYCAHKFIKDEVVKFFGEKSKNIKTLDLGCGTGVCTHFLKITNATNIAHGVDISGNMLEIAKRCIVGNKPIFDELYNEDISVFLENTKDKYNLIIASDSFSYIGAVENILEKCRQALFDDGLIIIVVRTANYNIENYHFDVKKSYFLYSESYFKNIADKLNFNCKIQKYKFEIGGDGILICYTKNNE